MSPEEVFEMSQTPIDIAAFCRSLGCEVQLDAVMADYTSFRIGGKADVLATAKNADEVAKIRAYCTQHAIPVLFLGNGSNLLVGDGGVRGVVLRLDGDIGQPELQGDTVLCSAGIPLKALCRFVRDCGLSGMEALYGIPGTVGGAVYMNAGAYGGQIADVLAWAEAVCPDGHIVRVDVEEMNLGYRHSVFMESGAIVTRTAFRLKADAIDSIAERMNDYMKRRRDKQPLEYPSAGSFFKRPPGQFAGALIESCQLKGFSIGGAQVSEKHAGFIINRGGATGRDVVELSKAVRQRVLDAYGVTLEPEVCFVGEFL